MCVQQVRLHAPACNRHTGTEGPSRRSQPRSPHSRKGPARTITPLTHPPHTPRDRWQLHHGTATAVVWRAPPRHADAQPAWEEEEDGGGGALRAAPLAPAAAASGLVVPPPGVDCSGSGPLGLLLPGAVQCRQEGERVAGNDEVPAGSPPTRAAAPAAQNPCQGREALGGRPPAAAAWTMTGACGTQTLPGIVQGAAPRRMQAWAGRHGAHGRPDTRTAARQQRHACRPTPICLCHAHFSWRRLGALSPSAAALSVCVCVRMRLRVRAWHVRACRPGPARTCHAHAADPFGGVHGQGRGRGHVGSAVDGSRRHGLRHCQLRKHSHL